MLTTFELDDYILASIRAGASGFLVKDTEPEELIAAVRIVAAGDSLLSPSVTRKLLAQVAATKPRAGAAEAGGPGHADRARARGLHAHRHRQ